LETINLTKFGGPPGIFKASMAIFKTSNCLPEAVSHLHTVSM